MIGLRLGLEQLLAPDLALGGELADPALLAVRHARIGIGPAGTKTVGRWPKDNAPISSPGTILSHTPSISAPSNMSCESATAVLMATTSRLNSESSIPARPCVMPSHMAGTPPANCATPPAESTAFLRIEG